MTNREELRRCKTTEPNKYICKQTQPLPNSHMQETCVIKLLQPRINIPKICDTRTVQLKHTIWTKLEQRNEWMYFIPMSDSITILRPEKEPLDILLTGTGKLIIQPNCKGYSVTALLATKTDVQVNTIKYGGDLLSKVESQFECCAKNLSHIKLDMHYKHIVSQVEDLKYASFKVSELEGKLKEQEWKHQHAQYHKEYSATAYILITLISIYEIYKLGRFLLRHGLRNKTVRATMGPTKDAELSTGPSGARNVVNISIKTSNESLTGSPEAIPLQDFDSSVTKGSTPELRRSRRLTTTKSYFRLNLSVNWALVKGGRFFTNLSPLLL